MTSDQKKNSHHFPEIMTISSILGGTLLRWYMIFIYQRPSDHLYSDMGGYASTARFMLDSAHRLHEFDLVQGPGTAFLLAVSLKLSGGFYFADWLWWILSSLSPVLWGTVAAHLPIQYDRPEDKQWLVAFVTFLTAFDLSHVTISCVFMPAVPFTFMVASGTALMLSALKKKGRVGAAGLSICAGIIWSLSSLFRGHGIVFPGTLIALLAVGQARKIRIRFKQNSYEKIDDDVWRRKPQNPVAFCLSTVMVTMLITGIYFHAKTGRFTTSSLNGAANIIIGHLPDATVVKFMPTDIAAEHHFGSTAFNDRMPTKTYAYPFSIINSKRALDAAAEIFKNKPLDFILTSFDNARFTFGGSYPWPANQMSIQSLVRLYESFLIIFGIFPAIAGLILLHNKTKEYDATALLGLPLIGIWIISFIVVGESRYRIPFDGSIFILAGLAWLTLWNELFQTRARI